MKMATPMKAETQSSVNWRLAPSTRDAVVSVMIYPAPLLIIKVH
jgi:hypothetical protein